MLSVSETSLEGSIYSVSHISLGVDDTIAAMRMQGAVKNHRAQRSGCWTVMRSVHDLAVFGL